MPGRVRRFRALDVVYWNNVKRVGNLPSKEIYDTMLRLFILITLLGCFAAGVPAQSGAAASPDDAVKNALKTGDRIPEFALRDALGKSVSSRDLTDGTNLVLVFYRGAWCPFCNKYLRQLQQNVTRINGLGGRLVAISAEEPETQILTARKNDLNYTVLSDPGLKVASMFGLVYRVPERTAERYRSNGLDLAAVNGTLLAELPIAATYVIRRDGTIAYAFLDGDYTKRAAPEILLAELEKIK